MERRSKQLTARLVELRNAIKQKYKIFKEGNVDTDIQLEKQYRPIIKELRRTQTKPDVKTELQSVKEEPMEFDPYNSEEDVFSPDIASTPLGLRGRELSLASTSQPSFRERELASPSTTQYVEEFFENPTTKHYMTLFFKDIGSKTQIDYVYGPRLGDDGSTLMVGNKNLEFDKEGNIIIGDVKYSASEGLYELLFKRTPDRTMYDEDDLHAYKSILIGTNAHRENYDFKRKIKSSRSTKYNQIIKLLFPTARGKGILWKTTKSHDIIHWDNPNELVERLKHIAMSVESGNRVHGNEIISIIEELREAGYIRGFGNSRFHSLLK